MFPLVIPHQLKLKLKLKPYECGVGDVGVGVSGSSAVRRSPPFDASRRSILGSKSGFLPSVHVIRCLLEKLPAFDTGFTCVRESTLKVLCEL